MTLHDTQTAFKDSLLRRKQDLPESDSSFAALFEDGGASFAFRHNIYHNNVIGTLARIVADKFPMLKILLGEEYLMQCARAYVIQSPPHDANLAYYGRDFYEFLSTRAELQSMAWLGDIARYETAYFLCETADDDDALSIEELQKITENEEQTLPLRASAKLLHLQYDPAPIIQLCTSKNNTDKIHVFPCDTYILLLRPHLETLSVSLSCAEYKLLCELQENRPLHYALNTSLILDSAFDVAAFFDQHMRLGTFVTHKTKREHSK